ncbi:MAG: YhbY family RNA-binding protein [Candidatus Woesearchaeota archaeon]|jgi:RNA-binding protein|nr:YhbY family RNA-binding protein [Candidatus Woesearchaeota archaeon]
MDTQPITKKDLKEKAKTLEPVIRIGKSGLSDGTIAEIKKQLEKKKLIKIKLLKAAIKDKDKKQLANELAEKTDSLLIDRVGFVVVLRKK